MTFNRVAPVLVVLLILTPIAFATYAVLARWVLHGEVDAKSLPISVSDAAGSLFRDLATCDRTSRPDVWRCSIVRGSGGADYLVTVEEDGSCWMARKVAEAGEGRSPGRIEGCVHEWQWSLLA